MLYAIAAIVAAISFTLVAFPLFQRRGDLELAVQPPDVEVEDLHSRREAVYGAIKELDFEYQLGNLSPADYQELRNQYRQRAASVLKELDEWTIPALEGTKDHPNREHEIEEAVGRLRAGGRKKPRREGTDMRFCLQCGASMGQSDRFCASCGASVALTCPACGAGLEAGDNFCCRCGARVDQR